MLKIRESAQEILNLYNYFDGAIIFDKDAVAVYYYNKRPEINALREEDVVGRHLSEIYPSLDLEKSTIMEALTRGTPTANMMQTVTTFKGQRIRQINTTIPILEEGNIIGAVEVSRYVTQQSSYPNIYVTPMDAGSHKLYTTEDIKSVWPGMEQIKKVIVKVANTDSSVLIYGKTGTGKEMVAEAIHTEGKRKQKRFIAQNCGAIPENLLESMLFGTVRGSFTGAENRIGLMEAADGGTLFLDEINTMGLALQAKLLKAIEDGVITRVGDVEPIPVDVRIIAALNQDPLKLVGEGVLRSDLYYRLKVVQINLPTLKEREGDIPYLADYFIRKYNNVFGKQILGLSREAEAFFQSYDWPGNVRELKNTIEGCFNFAAGTLIRMEDISWYDSADEREGNEKPVLKGTLKETVKAYEKQLIETALSRSESLSQATELLGITRQNLNNKIREYGLVPVGSAMTE